VLVELLLGTVLLVTATAEKRTALVITRLSSLFHAVRSRSRAGVEE
jgi:hypothetical protein